MKRIVSGIVLLLVGGALALASTYVPSTYTAESRDGRFLFVMISPFPVLEDAAFVDYSPLGREPSQVDRTREIRARYSRSGLYRNDGSSTPLWTVDGYSPSVAVSSDGVHFSALNDGDVKDLSTKALAFYENGEEIRKYNVADLISSSNELIWNFGGYAWLNGFSFDDERNTLSLTLVNGERYRFDIKNGEITRIERNPRELLMALLIGTSLVFLIITLFIIARRY